MHSKYAKVLPFAFRAHFESCGSRVRSGQAEAHVAVPGHSGVHVALLGHFAVHVGHSGTGDLPAVHHP